MSWIQVSWLSQFIQILHREGRKNIIHYKSAVFSSFSRDNDDDNAISITIVQGITVFANRHADLRRVTLGCICEETFLTFALGIASVYI